MRIQPVPITAPTVEPVTVAEANADARSDGTALDAMLAVYIPAARLMCEQETGQKLCTQTWRVEFDDWPEADEVIPLSPAVSAVVAYLAGGVWTTLATDQFVFTPTSVGGKLEEAIDVTWPTLAEAVGPRVRVDVTCGFGLAVAVPANLKVWIRAHVAAMVRNPEATSDRPLTAIPYLSALLDPHRVYGV